MKGGDNIEKKKRSAVKKKVEKGARKMIEWEAQEVLGDGIVDSID